jgi:heptosyltransferase-3
MEFRHRLKVFTDWLSWIRHLWIRRRGAVWLTCRLGFLRLQSALSGRPLVTITLLEHMGDLVAAEPVIRQLRREHPRARLVWICRKLYRELLDGHPELSAVLTVPCLSSWIAVRPLKLAQFQYDLHFDGRRCPICTVTLDNPSKHQAINAQNYYFHGSLLTGFCLVAGIQPVDDTPVLHVSAAVRDQVQALPLPDRFVAVHCTSNEDCRNWPREKWLTLVRWLQATHGLPVVELGLAPMLSGDPATPVHNLCGKLSPLATAEVIRRARLFIGIDSGCAHFANAFRIPGLILIGHYRNFTNHVPYSGFYGREGGAELVRANGPVEQLEVTAVQAAVDRKLSGTKPWASDHTPNLGSQTAV